jgi:hypothetical protein
MTTTVMPALKPHEASPCGHQGPMAIVAGPLADGSAVASVVWAAVRATDQIAILVASTVPTGSGDLRPTRIGKTGGAAGCEAPDSVTIGSDSGREEIGDQRIGGATETLLHVGGFRDRLERASCRVEHREHGRGDAQRDGERNQQFHE